MEEVISINNECLNKLIDNQLVENKNTNSMYFNMYSPTVVTRMWRHLESLRNMVGMQVIEGNNYLRANAMGILSQGIVESSEIKMKAIWSDESFSDLYKFHGRDMSEELISIISQELALEIIRRCLWQIRNAAGTIIDVHLADMTVRNKAACLVEHVNMMSTCIQNRCGGKAAWLATSPELCAYIERHEQYEHFISDGSNGYFCVDKVGCVGGIDVYKDPLMPTQEILMGWRGSNMLEAGYFFLPKVMMKKGEGRDLFMEAAYDLVDEGCYGRLRVRGLYD